MRRKQHYSNPSCVFVLLFSFFLGLTTLLPSVVSSYHVSDGSLTEAETMYIKHRQLLYYRDEFGDRGENVTVDPSLVFSKRTDIKKILILGAGPIVIDQACEFDYSDTQACKALREEGYQVILINSNPSTISDLHLIFINNSANSITTSLLLYDSPFTFNLFRKHITPFRLLHTNLSPLLNNTNTINRDYLLSNLQPDVFCHYR